MQEMPAQEQAQGADPAALMSEIQGKLAELLASPGVDDATKSKLMAAVQALEGGEEQAAEAAPEPMGAMAMHPGRAKVQPAY